MRKIFRLKKNVNRGVFIDDRSDCHDTDFVVMAL